MEPRKLVKAGQSSHTVSLPKFWLEKHALKSGDVVYVQLQGNDLVIRTQESSQATSPIRSITIPLDKKSFATIQREVTAAYINNYGTIVLVGDRVSEFGGELRSMLQGFVALEIAEQSEKQVVIKDFLNTKEISVDKTIRQMDMLVRSMIKDILAGEKTRIEMRDKDVNRLYFLLVRLLKSALKSPSVGVEAERLLSYWTVMINLENLADQCKSMSVLLDVKGKNSVVSYGLIYAQYEDVMKSYYTRDKLAADALASKREDLFKKLDALPSNVSENAKAMVSIINNIARVVIDEDS